MNEVKNYPPYLDYPKSHRPLTNADKIRAMSDEELDCFLLKVTYGMDECPYEYGAKNRSNGSSSQRKENDYETN